MNKKYLYLIVSLMSISLVGIIWVQVYWIHNSIEIKQAQFSQLVNSALNQTIDELQDDESVNFIHSHLAGISTNDSTKVITKKIQNWHSKKSLKDSTALVEAIKYEIISQDENGDVKMEVRGEDEENSSFNYSVTTDEDGQDMKMTISINGEEKLIELEDKLEKVEEILSDSLIGLSENHFEFSNRFGNIIIKMAKEFEGIEEPVKHLLAETNIEQDLAKSLADKGVDLPFTYAVIQNDELVPEFSSDGYDLNNRDFEVRLFKNNLLDNSAVLAIHFDGNSGYIFKSMWLMLLCSLVFTLIIIFTFGSTLHYMFKQKKLSEMKSDFINNMTHEFKTPISTISLAVDSITHPKIIDDKDQINHFADVIRTENARMNRQVESVLNTALGEKGELDLASNTMTVSGLLQGIPERMKLQLEHKQANFNLNLAEDQMEIIGDEMHLQNAVCNLIDNALKYNSNKPIINVSSSAVNGYARIDVTDNGIGMSSETQKKIFEKFYRVEQGNIHTTKGFGIGLSYVKAIVEGHGGSIQVASKTNAGTTISLFIPLKK